VDGDVIVCGKYFPSSLLVPFFFPPFPPPLTFGRPTMFAMMIIVSRRTFPPPFLLSFLSPSFPPPPSPLFSGWRISCWEKGVADKGENRSFFPFFLFFLSFLGNSRGKLIIINRSAAEVYAENSLFFLFSPFSLLLPAFPEVRTVVSKDGRTKTPSPPSLFFFPSLSARGPASRKFNDAFSSSPPPPFPSFLISPFLFFISCSVTISRH